MDYTVKTLCSTLSVSRSAYYAYLTGDTYMPNAQDLDLAQQVALVFHDNKRRYGTRRISKELQHQGIQIGRYAARSLMKAQGLQAIQPKSFVPQTTNSKHTLGYAPNLLKNNILPISPNRVYVGDITYLPTTYGQWLYLNTWMDLYSRIIVGWKIDTHMQESLVIDSLQKALYKRQPAPELIVHSDRGGQYASAAFKELLHEHKCAQSMSGADNPYDNAFAESFFSRFKAELLQKGAFESKEHANNDVFEFIEMYYNTQRLHSGIGYLSPVNYEKLYYQTKN